MLGIEVDVEKLIFSLPEEAKNHLVKELSEWCKRGVRKRVREWQQLAGWINWAFNVFPLLRPSLNNVYAKLKGKGQGARVWTNTAMREDLEWAKSKLDESDGVCLFKSLAWDVHKATCVAMTDACPEGYAFWFPDLNKGFVAPTPKGTPSTQIFFMKLWWFYLLCTTLNSIFQLAANWSSTQII